MRPMQASCHSVVITLPKCYGAETTSFSMNCTDCHAVAMPLGAPLYEDTPYPDPHYQVFTFMLNNADSSCPADQNFDGEVDGIDLAILLGTWATYDRVADLDGNGVVDGGDITILLGDWGPCPTPGGRSAEADRGADPVEDAAAVRRYLDALGRE